MVRRFGAFGLAAALLTTGGCSLEERLFRAVEREDLGEVRRLIAAGADVNAERPARITVLHVAARHDRADIVRALVAGGAEAGRFDRYGCTPLHNAAAEGHRAVAEALLEAGAPADARDDGGERLTPQHCAAYHPSDGVVRLLLARGANAHAKTHKGQTPLLMALHPEAGLHHVPERAERVANAVEALLAAGAAVGEADEEGNTPLHFAAQVGNKRAVKLLLAEGAAANVENANGFTPLHGAVPRGYRDVVEWLIAAGADVNADNARERWVVSMPGEPQAGARGEYPKWTYSGITPLHETIRAGRPVGFDIAKLLIEKGAKVNAADSLGRTPLHWAAIRDHVRLVELLVANGANIRATDCQGNTPLELAKERKAEKVIPILWKSANL